MTRHIYASIFSNRTGSLRIRWPVALKIALQTAALERGPPSCAAGVAARASKSTKQRPPPSRDARSGSQRCFCRRGRMRRNRICNRDVRCGRVNRDEGHRSLFAGRDCFKQPPCSARDHAEFEGVILGAARSGKNKDFEQRLRQCVPTRRLGRRPFGLTTSGGRTSR